MKELALTINGNSVSAPVGVPQGSSIDLGFLTGPFVGIFVAAAIFIGVIFIAYGGFLWVTSAGDKQKVEKARMTIVYSVIGISVAALSFVIVRIVGKVLGLDYGF